MAARKAYTQQAVTTGISADVKMTIKINDNYFSVSAHEDRTVPETANVDKEWEFLYESVYNVCAKEILEIQEQFSGRKNKRKS